LLTFIFVGIKVFYLQHEDFDSIWTWRVKESKSFGGRHHIGHEYNFVEVKQYCQGGKNLNPKRSGLLNKNVGENQFSMEEVLIVELAFFSYFTMYK
jgi:hypothetical protein